MKNYEMEVWGIAIDPFNQSPIVVLRNKENRREILPIWIGHAEASGIMMVLNNVDFSRPLTYELIKTIINNLGGKVEKVEISDIRDGTYYATIYVRDSFGGEHTIDARPSDAINIALRCGAPIFVAEKVMDSSKVVLDETFSPVGEIAGQIPEGSSEGAEPTGEGEKSEEFKKWLESIKPEDFENFGKRDKGKN
jgi:bifunctional DNase/RNase